MKKKVLLQGEYQPALNLEDMSSLDELIIVIWSVSCVKDKFIPFGSAVERQEADQLKCNLLSDPARPRQTGVH